MQAWKLIAMEEARRVAVETMKTLQRQIEIVGLADALGRICAGDIINPADIPPFNRSTVDGFALRSCDTEDLVPDRSDLFEVVGEARMGRSTDHWIKKGQAVRIPTGGMMPEGADAVIMEEHAVYVGEKTIRISKPLAAGQNVNLRGEDAYKGVVVVQAGRRIGVPDMGILASCGLERVSVFKKPVVTVVTTGDEIVSPGETPEPGQIRDVNTYTLSALSREAGCDLYSTYRVTDSLKDLKAVLSDAVRMSDVILISGGSSVGERDFTTAAVQALPGVKILFHGVSMKPGKPLLMAVMGKTVLFGIPGHTVAAMTVFREIVEPALAVFQGTSDRIPQFFIQARLGTELTPDKERDEIFHVRLECREGKIWAWPLPAKSGLISVMTRAQGVLYTNAGQATKRVGETVDIRVLPNRLEGPWRGGLR